MDIISSINTSSINTMSKFSVNYQSGSIDNTQSFQNILDITNNSIDIQNSNKITETITENKIERSENYNYEDYNKSDHLEEDKSVERENNITVNEKEDDKEEVQIVVAEKEDSNNIEDKNEDSIKEKIKNIKELLDKLKNIQELSKDDIKLTLKTIEELKENILSLEESLNLESSDKDEMKSILAALSVISKNLEENISSIAKNSVVEDVKIESKSKNVDNSTKNDIKDIKEKLEKVIESIENKTVELAKDTNIESTTSTIDNNSNNLVDNKIDTKTEKSKVQSEGRVENANNSINSSDENSEITVVRMKDSVDDISQRLNNSDNNIKSSSANKTDTIESAKNFQDMMSRLVDKAKVAVSEGKSEVVMTLKPERLGDVRLKIQIEGDEVNAKIFVDNAEIKDLFTKNIDSVIKSLSELNINVSGFDVMLQGDMSGDDMSEFKELLEKGENKSSFQKHNELDSNIKTIEKYTLPERRLNLVI